jgi:DNA gyrase subunit A
MGTHAMQFAIKTDRLIYLNFPPATLDLVTTTQRHEIIPVDRIQTYGKDGTGDKLLDLHPDEEIEFVN